ncbi:MAG: DUF3078 domain-containing protein [Prevotella sp.]|jgi:hypothetical protein|nr:DUF3078 domain-containing protein [Prevotella sp.]MCI1281365.1 DUF3078 domain-containing protein [Prevotella sp.]
MKFKYFLLIGLLFASVTVGAQTHNRGQRRRVSVANIVGNYTDSLAVFRQKLDSLMADSTLTYSSKQKVLRDYLGNETPGVEYNSLFLPTTFYKGVAKNNFELDSSPSLLDETLLKVYLDRPDLVERTETQLDKIGGTIEATPVKVEHAPDIVEQIAPKPIEPENVPVDVVIIKPNFWTFSGDYYLQFLQNFVSSNWYKGGESNYSMVGSVTLNANFNNKQKVKWENKLEMKLGFQTSREDSLHSMRASENLLRFTSKYGLQASKKWYYTAQLIAYTQFMRQWVSNSQTLTTDFLGPLVVNLSLGMDYNVDWMNHKLTGSVHLAPAAYNYKYVNRESLASRYGIDAGKHHLNDFGSQITVDLLWKFSDNISWKTRLYGYTTYQRAELEWENTLTFKFNRWISSNIFVYPRFDDGATRINDHSYWQLKEYASVGFSYSF